MGIQPAYTTLFNYKEMAPKHFVGDGVNTPVAKEGAENKNRKMVSWNIFYMN